MYIIYYKNIYNRGFSREISGNKGSTPRSRGGYAIYKVYLYRKGDYIKRYHDTKDSIKSIE